MCCPGSMVCNEDGNGSPPCMLPPIPLIQLRRRTIWRVFFFSFFESHHNNGQFYYSFSHYTVHAATSCMGEIKNNRLLVIILFPLWRKNWKKRRRRIYGGENQNQFKFFFVQYIVFFFVDVVVFTRFSQIHSVNW